ncbi:MAG: hypothetical protein JO276_03100 [Sphingomonadaceae bacterium]|nr:hypothetical protein [Sphingomonadaceae bacterium]
MRISISILAISGALCAAAAASAAPPARTPTRTPAAACHIALPASPDTESFTNAGATGAPARTQQTGAAFAAAATHLCGSGVVRPANLARYRSLLVRDAEGATEPNIYDDAEEHPGALIIEFAFAGGGAPSQAQIEAALRCWRNPHAAGCSTEDVGP